jgi:fatty-acyl-CoA synthase
MASHNNPDVGLGRMIGKRTALTPTNRALTFEGTTWTYAEFLDRIDRFADSLREGGITPGDRVGFLGFNHPVFLITMFAAARLGAIFVPLNFRLTASELDYIINDAGVHTIVADDSSRANGTSAPRAAVRAGRAFTRSSPRAPRFFRRPRLRPTTSR